MVNASYGGLLVEVESVGWCWWDIALGLTFSTPKLRVSFYRKLFVLCTSTFVFFASLQIFCATIPAHSIQLLQMGHLSAPDCFRFHCKSKLNHTAQSMRHSVSKPFAIQESSAVLFCATFGQAMGMSCQKQCFMQAAWGFYALGCVMGLCGLRWALWVCS